MTTSTKTAAPVLHAAEMTLDMVIVIGRTKDNTPQIICHGQNATGGLANLFAPVNTAPPAIATPEKKVELAPPAVKPTPTVAKSKADLLAEFKALGGNAGIAAKWGEEAIARNIAKLKATPTTPTVASTPAPVVTGPAKDDKPKGGGGFKKGSSMKKEAHNKTTASRALVKTKKGKEIEVWVVKEIKTDKFKGFLVCRPGDEDQQFCNETTLYGAVWAIPTEALIKWID